jgi:hypothetical protein
VGKKSSIAFGVIGIVLVVVAIVWWAALAPMLTKLPSDLDVKMDFEGQLTQYIDPATGQSLPAGQEVVVPLTILRTFAALPDKYTSSVAVCDDTVSMNIAGQEMPAQVTRYAMDRKTRKCIESNENWAYSPNIVLTGRVGYYGTLMPGGLKVGDTISLFSNDPAKVFDVKVVEKIDNYKGLGITAMKIDATRASGDYYAPIAQALLGGQGLPMELTFAQLSAQLKAKGLDLETLLAALASVATPEDMLSLQAMTQQPVKVIYKRAATSSTSSRRRGPRLGRLSIARPPCRSTPRVSWPLLGSSASTRAIPPSARRSRRSCRGRLGWRLQHPPRCSTRT